MYTELEKIPSFFRFEDLRVYHKSIEYTTWLIEANKNFDQKYFDMFIADFVKASTRITSQMVEGSCRNKNQFVYYLKMSKSAIRDCVIYTATASKLGLFNETQDGESRQYLIELTKMVGALITSLQGAPDYKTTTNSNNNAGDEFEPKFDI